MNFKNFLIALEKSEDITTGVQDELNDDTSTPEEENDIGKTDNIFGADENDDVGDTPEDDPPGEDVDDNEGDIDMDTSSNEEDLGDDHTNPEIAKKVNLRTNMIMLHNILDSNIETLLNYTPSQNTKETSKILYDIVDNLTECKRVLLNEILNNFSTKSYTSLLKTYVAVNRVYELAQKSLEKYFGHISIETPKKRKK